MFTKVLQLCSLLHGLDILLAYSVGLHCTGTTSIKIPTRYYCTQRIHLHCVHALKEIEKAIDLVNWMRYLLDKINMIL